MSRFSNLEFGGGEEEQPQQLGAPLEVKDEAYYFAEANASFARGQFERALRAFAKTLEENSQNAAAWTGQVRALIELGEFREAKLWADKALEKFPNEPELLAAKGVALGRLGDYENALAYSDASIEERGDTPYIWLARGDVLLAREEGAAEFCFGKALSMAHREWFWHWLSARIHYFHQKFSVAIKYIQQALALDATQSVIWLQLGLCQQSLGMVSLAGTSFEQARQLDPSNLDAERAMRAMVNEDSLWSRFRGKMRKLLEE